MNLYQDIHDLLHHFKLSDLRQIWYGRRYISSTRSYKWSRQSIQHQDPAPGTSENMYQKFTLPSTGMYDLQHSNNQVCNHLLETNLVFFLYNCSDLRANNQNLSEKLLKICPPNYQNPTSQLRDQPAVPQRRGPPQHLPHSITDPEHHEKSPLGSEIDFHQSVH